MGARGSVQLCHVEAEETRTNGMKEKEPLQYNIILDAKPKSRSASTQTDTVQKKKGRKRVQTLDIKAGNFCRFSTISSRHPCILHPQVTHSLFTPPPNLHWCIMPMRDGWCNGSMFVTRKANIQHHRIVRGDGVLLVISMS